MSKPQTILNAAGDLEARTRSWWAAHMKGDGEHVSAIDGITIAGDGHVRVHWHDDEESGAFHISLASLYAPSLPDDRTRRLVEAARPFSEAAMHLHPANPDGGLTLDGIEARQWREIAAALAEFGEGE